jgi:hypothetical protein
MSVVLVMLADVVAPGLMLWLLVLMVAVVVGG